VKSSPTRTKGIKGLIKNNNPLPFTAGNAFPLPKSRVTSRTPTGKPTVKEVFPIVGSQPGSQQQLKKSFGQGQDAKSKEAYAIEHHGVRHHLIGAVAYHTKGTIRPRFDRDLYISQVSTKTLQTLPRDKKPQCQHAGWILHGERDGSSPRNTIAGTGQKQSH
jgi:hypothetical protein